MTRLSLKFATAFLLIVSASLLRGQVLQTLYGFGNATPSALTLGNDGNFYGTLYGSSGSGTVFRLTTSGVFTNLATFYGTNGADATGLTLGSDGNFYGTTFAGGSGSGTVFRVTTNGALTLLARFPGTAGVHPSTLAQGSDGNFYGTTFYGGVTNALFPQGMGGAFKVTTNGVLTTLVSFNFTNGAASGTPLVLGSDGNFYGTTEQGGQTNSRFPGGLGTVFRMTTNGALTSLAAFDQTNGATPLGSLAFGATGALYGAAFNGGVDGDGTVFQVDTNDVLTAVASFYGTNGANPLALVTANGGSFYGTTQVNGAVLGELFEVTTNGGLTPLISFSSANGQRANGLTLGSDGNFYGTTLNVAFRLKVTPNIVLQPQNASNYAGANATFSVAAQSPEPMNYQWIRNGTNLANGGNISGATSSRLTIAGILDGDAATYSVIVKNAEGTVTSSTAVLTVNDALFFPTQPISQTIGAGRTVTLAAAVYGRPPFVFQWYFNGAATGSPSTGTNFSTLTLTNVGNRQAGNYTVEVFNSLGGLTSSNALLTVIPQPALSLQISAGYPLLNLQGALGYNFTVQYTTNLFGPWSNLLSLTNLSNSPYPFLDPGAVGEPERFYRAFFGQ